MKKVLYQFCEDYILGRLQRIKVNIEEINTSLNSETKSSAGDKHETGRAMVQLEREKLGRQLLEAEKTFLLLQRAKNSKPSTKVSLGSLVKTSNSTYYIAISAGKLVINSKETYCISPNTPIGKLLFGKSEDDVFIFNNKEFKILKIS